MVTLWRRDEVWGIEFLWVLGKFSILDFNFMGEPGAETVVMRLLGPSFKSIAMKT